MLGFWDQNNKFTYLPAGDLPDSCWSLYLRNKAYTGSCIRIATSAAGNAETDIGFINGRVNTAAILSHVGSNTAWVVTIYDQIGSNNLTKIFGLNSYAPRIATGGNIITFANGQPAIEFGQGTSEGASGLYRTTGDLFPSGSTLFYSYESTYTGLHVIGGSGSATTPFFGAGGDADSSNIISSSFSDPDPYIMYVDGATGVNKSLATVTRDDVYEARKDSLRIIAEPGLNLTSGNGFSWGMRGENSNSYFRGKSSEMIIYNDVRSSTQSFDIMSILNKTVKSY